MGTIFPFWPEEPPLTVPVGLRRFEPPLDNVYMLASIVGREGACDAGRLGGALGGGGGAVGADAGGGGGTGAAPGGGGGGAAGEARPWPKAFRAACSASEGVWPFVGGGGAALEDDRDRELS